MAGGVKALMAHTREDVVLLCSLASSGPVEVNAPLLKIAEITRHQSLDLLRVLQPARRSCLENTAERL